jgi:hypothetical protein
MAELHRPHAGGTGHGSTDNVEVHHEESDVNIVAIFGFGGALFGVAVVAFLLVYVLFGFFNSRDGRPVAASYPLAAAQGERRPPEPRLQEHPREDLEALREREEQILTTYGVVDQNAGVYRIPVEQAMKLTLERGLPARQESK